MENTVRGRIERVVHGGYGLMRTPAGVVLVRGALAGEGVTAAIGEVRHGLSFAETIHVHEPAAGRRREPCFVARECGGCQFQFAEPSAQERSKREALDETLRRGGVAAPVREWTSGPETEWRSRIALHGAAVDGVVRAGFHPERSHDLVPASSCLQVSPALRSAVLSIEAGLADIGGGVVSETSSFPPGFRFEIDVVENFEGGEIVAGIATVPPWPRSRPRPARGPRKGGPRADRHVDRDDRAVGRIADRVARAVDDARFAGVALRETDGAVAVVRGRPYVTHRVGAHRYRQHVFSFFQANRFLTERLVARVVELAGPANRVLDLFAGVGLFAVAFAARGVPTVAVEWSERATDDLRHNAHAHACDSSLEVREASVTRALEDVADLEDVLVLVDPPRRGLDPRDIERIHARGAMRIIYVSCDASTLVRDLRRFSERGFAVESVEAFDLFPTTFHTEVVAVLAR